MTAFTVVPVTRAGVDVAGSAVSAGPDTFANTGKEILEVNNASGGSITVTIPVTATPDGMAVASDVITIANGIRKAIGPFPTGIYNNGSGNVSFTCSATSSVTAKVLSVTAGS